MADDISVSSTGAVRIETEVGLTTREFDSGMKRMDGKVESLKRKMKTIQLPPMLQYASSRTPRSESVPDSVDSMLSGVNKVLAPKAARVAKAKKTSGMGMIGQILDNLNEAGVAPGVLGGMARWMRIGAKGGAAAVAGFAVFTAITDILTQGFSVTIKVLGNIIKVLSLILKPLDLIFATILVPLFSVLMPFIKLMNMIFRPIRMAMIAYFNTKNKETGKSPMEELAEAAKLMGTEGKSGGTTFGNLFGIGKGFQKIVDVYLGVFGTLIYDLFKGLIGSIVDAIGGGALKAIGFDETEIENLRVTINNIVTSLEGVLAPLLDPVVAVLAQIITWFIGFAVLKELIMFAIGIPQLIVSFLQWCVGWNAISAWLGLAPAVGAAGGAGGAAVAGGAGGAAGTLGIAALAGAAIAAVMTLGAHELGYKRTNEKDYLIWDEGPLGYLNEAAQRFTGSIEGAIESLTGWDVGIQNLTEAEAKIWVMHQEEIKTANIRAALEQAKYDSWFSQEAAALGITLAMDEAGNIIGGYSNTLNMVWDNYTDLLYYVQTHNYAIKKATDSVNEGTDATTTSTTAELSLAESKTKYSAALDAAALAQQKSNEIQAQYGVGANLEGVGGWVRKWGPQGNGTWYQPSTGRWYTGNQDPNEKGYAQGGFVGETGMYMLHAGEQVIPSNKVNDSAGNTINITINADVSNDYDVKRLADEVSRHMQIEMSRRTSYGSRVA